MPEQSADSAPLTITPRAAAKLKAQADFGRAVLSIRHLLGCGGNGFRVSIEENSPDEGHLFQASGIPVVMDDYAFHKLQGAVLEVDDDPGGEGYRLNHPEAVLTTFC
jgi:Fe-S cluster assembly iron-binding protein IscA